MESSANGVTFVGKVVSFILCVLFIIILFFARKVRTKLAFYLPPSVLSSARGEGCQADAAILPEHCDLPGEHLLLDPVEQGGPGVRAQEDRMEPGEQSYSTHWQPGKIQGQDVRY